jgi:hypothetical protein
MEAAAQSTAAFGSGTSVKSTEFERIALISEFTSDKKGVVRVSIPGPAGVQYSEQTFAEDLVGHGAGTALASGIDGRLEMLLVEIPRAKREQTTASNSTSLTAKIAIDFSMEQRRLMIKAYPATNCLNYFGKRELS